MYTPNDHTFVIPAYKDSPYLENCILSLRNQTVPSQILLETSTPSEVIHSLARKYQIPVSINPGPSSCAKDWNYGYQQATTKLVTIAHQDDIYTPEFLKETLAYLNHAKQPILVYTDYYEIRGNRNITNNMILSVKRFLNHPMKNAASWDKANKKTHVLKYGNAISCPTVTLVKERIGDNPFDLTYQCSCDYQTWINLSKLEGSFVYVPKQLMGHRIYKESHTSIYLNENIRQKEDSKIISSFWPKGIGPIVYRFYSLSQKSNDTE